MRKAISSAGSHLLDEVVMPAISQAERAFSGALARISVKDLTQSARGLKKPPRTTEPTDLSAQKPLRGSA
jgi:hypothetical protein